MDGTDGTSYGPSFNVAEMLENRANFARQPHGWYAVSNRSDKNISDFYERHRKMRDDERNYFDNTAPYHEEQLRRRCGTMNLIHKLSRYVLCDF